MSMVREQLVHTQRSVDASYPTHPHRHTFGPMGCAYYKSLMLKGFFGISTETIHRYLLLLSLYIQKRKQKQTAGRLVPPHLEAPLNCTTSRQRPSPER